MRPALVALLLAACSGGTTSRGAPVMGGLEARYRLATRGRTAPVAATRVYRSFVARSLFSRCRMLPSDSAFFDARARECGAFRATYIATARLFLEAAAEPRLLRPVAHGGRLLWLDLPKPRSCAP